MVNTKKITGSTLALVVVSVLLVMSLTLGITLAWFNASDTGSDLIKFAQSFDIEVKNSTGAGDFDIVTPGERIIPGSVIRLNSGITASYQAEAEGDKNVPFLLRVKFDISVDGVVRPGSGYTGEDAVVLEAIYQAFYTSIGNAVKSTNKWVLYNGYFYYVGNDTGAFNMTSAMGEEVVTGSMEAFGAHYNSAAAYSGLTEVTTEAEAEGIMLSSIYSGTGPVTIPFLTEATPFRLSGSSFDNGVQGKTVTVSLSAQAVQDAIYDFEEEPTPMTNTKPNLDLARKVFEDAFPIG